MLYDYSANIDATQFLENANYAPMMNEGTYFPPQTTPIASYQANYRPTIDQSGFEDATHLDHKNDDIFGIPPMTIQNE